MGHGCLMYTIVVVLIIFNAGPNAWKRITSPTTTHGKFCKIGIFWNTNFFLKYMIDILISIPVIKDICEIIGDNLVIV
jgi:hypothetical protein